MINLGVSDISQVKEDSPDIVRIKAAKIDLHPDYNFSQPFHGNDLAVVRLERRVEVSHTVSPACFPLSKHCPRALSQRLHTLVGLLHTIEVLSS